jgi:hypothetical protein
MDCFVASAPLRKRFAFVAGNDEGAAVFRLQSRNSLVFDGLAVTGERKRRRPSDGYARQGETTVEPTHAT